MERRSSAHQVRYMGYCVSLIVLCAPLALAHLLAIAPRVASASCRGHVDLLLAVAEDSGAKVEMGSPIIPGEMQGLAFPSGTLVEVNWFVEGGGYIEIDLQEVSE